MKLPKLLLPKRHDVARVPVAGYLCTIDRQQREKHYFVKEDGSRGMLWIDRSQNNDNKVKWPNIGTIVKTFGQAQFKPGDVVITNHYCFTDSTGHFKVLYTDEQGTEYYAVMQDRVYFAIKPDGNLELREGILLCEPIMEKVSEIYLNDHDKKYDYRRDVVKVLQVWDGCQDVKPGDYLLLEKGGDYLFEHNKQTLVKVDYYRNDVIGVIKDPEVRFKQKFLHRSEKNW